MQNTNKTQTMNDLSTSMAKMESWLKDIFVNKLPPMPTNAKEVLVKYGPYLTIIVLVLSLPAILFALGIGAFLAPVAMYGGVGAGVHLSVAVIFLIITVLLEIMSVPGLLKRSRQGWNLAYYAVLVNAVYALFSGNLVGVIISTGLGLWVLFQIQEYYK